MTVNAEQLAAFGLIGAPEDQDLKVLARLAAQICGVPTATVNLLDDVHQYNVAVQGFEREVVPLEESFCATTVQFDQPVYVRDARTDPRFASHPHVTGELGQIRFYAGCQLRTAAGVTVGTLCVFDEVERDLDPGQRLALDDLAAQAVQVLEMRAKSMQLAATNVELIRSNDDLAAFAGRVAHDLRNPLSATKGFLAMAHERFGEELTGSARQCVGYAISATDRMVELIDVLLDYASVGARALAVPVDVADLVAAVANDVQPLIASTGGRLEVGALPTIDSDPTLLRQLLQNLVTNGLKYGRADVAPVVRIAGSSDERGWSIAVSDNGRGIPDEDRGSVFELFVRLQNGLDVRGSGIGLATCARVADALGGTIAITDTEGGGTTFTLSVQATA